MVSQFLPAIKGLRTQLKSVHAWFGTDCMDELQTKYHIFVYFCKYAHHITLFIAHSLYTLYIHTKLDKDSPGKCSVVCYGVVSLFCVQHCCVLKKDKMHFFFFINIQMQESYNGGRG